ncbi:MAG TPA: hypothetical protein VJR28_06630, partial [Chthoniobacterales bacterium]|nr:hypothetical protein [Chthoniobacterales bacterium]
MAAGNVISGLRFGALITAVFASVGSVDAQEGGSGGHGAFGVPLQPFLAGQTVNDSARAEPMRVAYYTPRAQSVPAPRAEAVEEENNDAEIAHEAPIRSNRPIVEGSRAVLRNGIAYAPSEAPDNIKNAIWAVNSLRQKPYV